MSWTHQFECDLNCPGPSCRRATLVFLHLACRSAGNRLARFRSSDTTTNHKLSEYRLLPQKYVLCNGTINHMSLYYEAADLLANASDEGGSLKSRIYKRKGLKSNPAHIYALIMESRKWSSILKDVIEDSELLIKEKKVLDALLRHFLRHLQPR